MVELPRGIDRIKAEQIIAVSFQPAVDRLREKLGRIAPFVETADATEIWAPAAVTQHPPIIQLPDEADRAVAFTVSRAEFIERTRPGEREHPPTVARLYRQATIFRGSIYTRRSFSRVYETARRFGWAGIPEHHGDRLLATNHVAEKYFGHWLLDGLSLELLARQSGHQALGLAREPWLQEAPYRALTGIMLERTALAVVDRLWVADDRPMNGGRIARMRELRRLVRAKPPADMSRAPVFLRRVGGARRLLLNQEQLAEALARRGFTVLTPELEPFDSLRCAIHNASLVVSVEGSALCHALAGMADGGTVLAIQPPRRVDWIQKVWTDCAGLRLAQTIADDRGDGFEIGEDRLMRLCDLIAAENPF